MAKEKDSKLACISIVATDQGTGGAYCSNCGGDLDHLVERQSSIIREILDIRFRHYKENQQIAFPQIQISELKKELSALYVCPHCHYDLWKNY